MKDTRLYFIKDPFVFIPLFLFFGGLFTIEKLEKPKVKPKVQEVTPAVQKDTTEWRNQYYEHLYNSTK